MGFGNRLRRGWRSLPLGEGTGGATPSGADPASAPGPDRAQTSTFIGSGPCFEGTLRLTGDICIDSDFHGSLTTDGSVLVGASGSVEGDICAREVVIAGAVVGRVTARRRLILRPSARLHGDIETACLEVERHAFFQGRTRMTRPQSDPRPAPPAEATTPSGGPR